MLRRRRTPQLYWVDVARQDTLDGAVATVERAYRLAEHPYFQWMRDPATTRDEFRRTQVPFRFAVEAFSQALAGVLARIPRLEARMSIAENVAEEHGRGELAMSHKYTFLGYLTALGVTPDELDAPCPIWITAFNHSLRNLCLAQTHECGAAALGVIEHLYVGASATIARAIVERAWAAPGGQQHYTFHEVLDASHARDLFDVARPGWDAPLTRSSVALGLLLGAYYFWNLYEELLPEE